MIVLATAIAVYVDATSIGVKKGLTPGFTDMGAGAWAFCVFFLWIIALPMYLVKRSRYRAIAAAEVVSPVERHARVRRVRMTIGMTALLVTAGLIGGRERRRELDAERVHDYAAACDAKDYVGCYNLGVTYQRAIGQKQNLGMAVSLYDESCTHEVYAGCYNLGLFYLRGVQVSQDPQRGRLLIAKACKGGVAEACAVQ
ncbi:MAG: hypothetical protein QM831_12815 [Kofleriaceae bacterium]